MIRNHDDIDKEKVEETKREIREGFNDIMGGVMDDFEDLLKRKKMEKQLRENKRKKGIWERITSFFIILFLIGVLMSILNFLLGNIWLLRFFIKSLF